LVFEFELPDVGEGIHEGEIVEWHVDEGDQVAEDQHVVDVMTDKATVEISAPVAGTIQDIVCGEGETVEVGEVFVLITPDEPADVDAAEPTPEEPDAEPAPEPDAEPAAAEAEPARTGGTNGGVVTTRTPEDVLAPPRVRLEARKRGIDVAQVDGSGPAGRVTLDDLDAHEPDRSAREPEPAPSGGPAPVGGFDLPSVDRSDAREIASMRAEGTRAGAHRATTLQPHFTHAVSVDAEGLQAALDSSVERAEAAGVEVRPVVAVVKALAQALGDHPRLNALVNEEADELVLKEPVNVGVAWPTEDGHEVRVVERADDRGLLDIARALADGGEDATPTVTAAVLDDEDAYVSTPVLQHPQVTGLVVGSVDEVPVLDDGRIRPGREVNLSFVFDHRWIDGYHGALLAEDVRELLARPEAMLLG